MSERTGRFDPYVTRVASDWDVEASGSLWRPVVGSLVFVDISGFTNLSERLARRGRIGAEELTSVLNRVFGRMLDVVYGRGGSLLKFGGDALLLLFETEDHVMQATAAVVEMRTALRDAAKEPTSVGRIHLKMSSGVHSGPVDFFLVGDSHRELIVTGPTVSMTTEMEATADAGEIVVSPAVKERLPGDFVGEAKGNGWLLRKQKIHHPPHGLVARRRLPDEEMGSFVSRGLREVIRSGVDDSEHRISTVGFVKFKGVDALLADEGPERVGEELDLLVRTVQEAVDGENVTFLASDIDADGGKIILTAGVPTSHRDDEGRMLRAARRILDTETGLKVRIGVNRGHVFSGDVGTPFRSTYTVMGDTVNLAARLMAAASPGMLYASPAVLDRSSTLFRTEALVPFYVKGKEQPVQAYAVFEETGVRRPEARHELLFAGRERELSQLVGMVSTCATNGTGGVVTITGDAGIGKSRLIAEVLERSPIPMVLVVQAEPNGANNPYWALRDPMRRMLEIDRGAQDQMIDALRDRIENVDPALVPALPLLGDVMHIDVPDTPETAAIEPRFRPERTADAVVRLFETLYRTQQFAVLAEGCHWMDEASINLLRRIGSATAGRIWTVIFTARGSEEFTPIGEQVALGPLEDETVRKIAIDATAAAPIRPHELDAVVIRAGGNPLFLGEILRVIRETGSADQLPESLDAVVSSEIDTLPPLSRQLLRYSAVLGSSFRRKVLDEFLDPEQIQLDDATRRDLARFISADGPSRFRFRNSVVHDVAYEGLSYRRRRELHARAGGVIERLAGSDPDNVAEFLAHHFALSGEYEKAWRYSRVAGEKARDTYANVEASRHYERAIEAARRIDSVTPDELRAVWTDLGKVREQAGLFEGAFDALRAATRLVKDDPVARAEIHLERARTRFRTGRHGAVMRETATGLRTIEGLEGRRARITRARLLSVRAWARLQQGKARDALAVADRATEEAQACDDADALARAYSVLDNAYELLGEPNKAVNELKALEIYESSGNLQGVAMASNNLGVRAYSIGQWQEAIERYRRAIEAFHKIGNAAQAGLAAANLGEVLVSLGRTEEAEDVLSEARRVLRSHDMADFAIFADAQFARLEMERGNPASARDSLRRLVAEATAVGHAGIALDTAIHLADSLVRCAEADEALEVITAAEREAGEAVAYFESQLKRIKGRALALMGKRGEARALLDEALRAARDQGLPYDQAMALKAIAALDGSGEGSPNATEEEAERLLLGLTS